MKQGTQQPAAVLFAATQAEIVESNLDGKKEQRNDKQDLQDNFAEPITRQK